MTVEERLKLEKLTVEKMKVETHEKIAIMNEAVPRLELKKFDGNILNWQKFWDKFESTIHKKYDLQNLVKCKQVKCQWI